MLFLPFRQEGRTRRLELTLMIGKQLGGFGTEYQCIVRFLTDFIIENQLGSPGGATSDCDQEANAANAPKSLAP